MRSKIQMTRFTVLWRLLLIRSRAVNPVSLIARNQDFHVVPSNLDSIDERSKRVNGR